MCFFIVLVVVEAAPVLCPKYEPTRFVFGFACPVVAAALGLRTFLDMQTRAAYSSHQKSPSLFLTFLRAFARVGMAGEFETCATFDFKPVPLCSLELNAVTEVRQWII